MSKIKSTGLSFFILRVHADIVALRIIIGHKKREDVTVSDFQNVRAQIIILLCILVCGCREVKNWQDLLEIFDEFQQVKASEFA